MEKVNVFISSTCYDLAQIRTDLKEFIISLGHNPMLSEEHNFPVDPKKGTVENCIDAVRKYANIFILIIGNRYGEQLENGKSITNTEFLTAIEKNIPIYTFTLKRLIHIQSVWQDNKDGDYSRHVDNPQIFEFLEDVRQSKKYWNFEFENAQDIIRTLKEQWSYLFSNALYYRGIFNKNNEYKSLYSKISSNALQIILEKEDSFEPKFFIQCCNDELSKYEPLKNDYIYSIILQVSSRTNTVSEFTNWAQIKIDELLLIISSFNSLLTGAFKHFFGDPGIPSDLNGLYYAAQTYGRIYASFLQWSIDIRSLSVEDDYKDCRNAIADMARLAIQEMERYPSESLKQIEEAEERIRNGEKNIKIEAVITLNMDSDALKRYNIEINKLKRKIKWGQIS